MIPILSVVVKMPGTDPMDKEIGIEKRNSKNCFSIYEGMNFF
jgi:hypothetical protein